MGDWIDEMEAAHYRALDRAEYGYSEPADMVDADAAALAAIAYGPTEAERNLIARSNASLAAGFDWRAMPSANGTSWIVREWAPASGHDSTLPARPMVAQGLNMADAVQLVDWHNARIDGRD